MTGSLRVRLLACLWLLPALAAAGEHPIETQLRGTFPSLSLQSSATLDAADAVVGGRTVPGFQARFAPKPHRITVAEGAPPQQERIDDAPPTLRMHYPRSYDDALVVEMNGQRLVLRAVGTSAAFAVETGGKLLYERPFPFTEVLEVPGRAGSQQLLLMHDRRAPRVYEWEIVETQGIAGVILDDGALRFLSTTQPAPTPTEMRAGRFSHAPLSLRIARPAVIDAEGRRSETAARWTLVGQGPIPSAIRLTLSNEALSYPRVVEACFCGTGSMSSGRYNHTATLLPSGKVLVTGGRNNEGDYLTSAELYDPNTGSFTTTGSLGIGRAEHTATLLQNGKVLIVGGQNGGGFTLTAELYDPITGTFASTGNPNDVRNRASATLLTNGKVLLVNNSTAELYDPATGIFTLTGAPTVARFDQTATLLPNGKVLIAAGFFSGNLSTAEIYDPGTSTFTPTGSLIEGRFHHTATLLPNGKVLITAGYDYPDGPLATAELYNPTTGTFSATGSLAAARYLHAATQLPDGKVLISGGSTGFPLASTELYDPTSATFSPGPDMGTARFFHTATLLPNGQILMAGSFGVASTEIYHPEDASFTPTGDLGAARKGQTATLLPNAKVLIAGGYGPGDLNSAELYDAAAGTFTPTGNLGTARGDHTATLLPNGKVLIVGGTECCASVTFASAQLYDPGPGTFSGTGSLAKARSSHTATLLPNGKVLIAGGWDRNVGEIVATAELYDPVAGTFSGTGSMGTARSTHTATLMANGKVLIAGGENFVSGSLDSAEIYDPITGTFSGTGNLETARNSHTAALLPNGNVLLVAGSSSQLDSCLSSAELYDPNTGTFVEASSLVNPRTMHTSTVLPDGRVLIVGGRNCESAFGSAELYDPATGFFHFANSVDGREWHTATLLTNGKVLVAGGESAVDGPHQSAYLWDVGLGFSESRRPVVSSAPVTQTQPATMTLSGSGFRGDSEASSSTTTSSPTNYPLLHFQRIDNDQIVFVRSSVAWSATSFTSATISGLPSGHYRVTIFTNGIPSVQRLVSFTDPGPPPQMSINNVAVTEGNAGTTMATFTVSLSAPGGAVTVQYATADGTATSTGSPQANPAAISIPVGSAATPYPSSINVAGLTGTITKVTATLTGFSHTFPRDVDVLLVGPGGQSVVLMSDPGVGEALTDLNLTFDDAAANQIPLTAIVSGTYKPTNLADGDGSDFYPPPAPAEPYGSMLSVFNATSPNGTWNLYVVDDVAPFDGGAISGGWSLTFTTTSSDFTPTTGTLTIPMGLTSATISVPVNGDTIGESNEIFFVNLSNAVNATILDGQGQGTINNDDNPAAPPNVVATATGSTSVTVNWTVAPGATSYRVYRGSRTGGVITYALIGSPGGTTLNDNAVSAGTSYLYKVRAFFTSESGDSNIDLATTILFTDPTLVAGTTKAKLAHFTELLTAVNAARTLAGLGAAAFTAPTPTTAITVRRQHLLDLRTALNAARSTLALTAISYTDPTITAGSTKIKAAHITELRSGVQ